MSIPVALGTLPAVVRDRGPAGYVLTVSDRGSPHVVHAEIEHGASGLVAAVGAGTARNANQRPEVTVLYPSRSHDDYSLIVDAVATVISTPDGFRLLLAATRAVLHRAVPAPEAAGSVAGERRC